MTMKKLNLRFSVLAFMIILAGISRLIVHIPNFTPIGAMALFGGAYFSDRWKAYLMPLMSLFLSDMIIQGVFYEGQYGFPLYQGWYWVYGTFVLIVFFGQWIIKKVTVGNVLMASIAASLAHWIITDFWVWQMGCTTTVYTKDWNGFVLCYKMAIPCLQGFLLGTLAYSAVFFGIFEIAQRQFPVLKLSANKY